MQKKPKSQETSAYIGAILMTYTFPARSLSHRGRLKRGCYMAIIKTHSKFLAIRLAGGDRAWLEKLAEQRGITMTEAVRACIVAQRESTTVIELMQSIRDDITAHISDSDHRVLAALESRMEPIARASAEMLTILRTAQVQ